MSDEELLKFAETALDMSGNPNTTERKQVLALTSLAASLLVSARNSVRQNVDMLASSIPDTVDPELFSDPKLRKMYGGIS